MNLPEVLSLEEAAERLNELERENEKLASKLSTYIFAVDEVFDRRYLRYTSVLTSYPVQNAAIWDLRSKITTILEEQGKAEKVKQYLSQGYSPAETGMALNMSLEDVLKIAEEQK